MPYLLEILGKTRGLDHERELLGNGETLVDLKRLWLGGQSFHINNDGGAGQNKSEDLFIHRTKSVTVSKIFVLAGKLQGLELFSLTKN